MNQRQIGMNSANGTRVFSVIPTAISISRIIAISG